MGEAVVINIPPKCDQKTQLSKEIFRNILKITQILLDSILSQQIKTTVNCTLHPRPWPTLNLSFG